MTSEELLANFNELEEIGAYHRVSHTERLEGHQDFVSELDDETALRMASVLTERLNEDPDYWRLANTTNSYWARVAIVADFCRTKAHGGPRRFKAA